LDINCRAPLLPFLLTANEKNRWLELMRRKDSLAEGNNYTPGASGSNSK
jgi:hypothetical protein